MKCLFALFTAIFLSVGAYGQYSLKKFDINQLGSSYPIVPVEFAGKLFFIANDSIHGYEPWWSDGDTTVLFTDIFSGKTSLWGSKPIFPYHYLIAYGNNLYLMARDSSDKLGIFISDGTQPFTNIGYLDSTVQTAGSMVGWNGKIYFPAYDSAHEGQIWAFNPANGLSQRITNVSGGLAWWREEFIVFQNKLIFTVADPTRGLELYQCDPFTGLGGIVADICPNDDSWASGFCIYKNKLFFVAFYNDEDADLYMYDGVNLPLRLHAVDTGYQIADHLPITVYRNKLHFTATKDFSDEPAHLFSYDPASGTSTMIPGVNCTFGAFDMEVYAGKLFLVADTFGAYVGDHILVYDGNTISNFATLYTNGIINFIGPHYLTNCNSKLFFRGTTWPSNDNELYVFTDSIALGINHTRPANAEVQIHPNPASEEVTLSMTLKKPERLSIRLVDMQGKIVYTAVPEYYLAATHKIILPVQNLPAGNYVYLISNVKGNILHSGTLVKQ